MSARERPAVHGLRAPQHQISVPAFGDVVVVFVERALGDLGSGGEGVELREGRVGDKVGEDGPVSGPHRGIDEDGHAFQHDTDEVAGET
jgi:hypothetical protein